MLLLPEGSGSIKISPLPADSSVGKVVRMLQYGVREGGEAGEVVCILEPFIADCNQSFILQYREALDG